MMTSMRRATAGGFGLSYDAMNGTDTRSELGGRFDDMTALGTMPLLLRAKVSWAHDFQCLAPPTAGWALS
jgi:uncharacterized protein with beta-barrel porin domain